MSDLEGQGGEEVSVQSGMVSRGDPGKGSDVCTKLKDRKAQRSGSKRQHRLWRAWEGCVMGQGEAGKGDHHPLQSVDQTSWL